MKNRSIALWIILSIVTCGIMGIVWFILLTNDMNQLATEDGYQTTGCLALLLTLVTCGIYGIYWNYRMGVKMDNIKHGGSHAVLFLLLSIFGLGIVNYCIMQSAINEAA